MINMTTEEFKTALYALVDDEHTVITNSAISDGISLIDGKINIHNVKITSEHFIFGDGSNKTRLITYADLTGVDVSSVTDLSSCFNDYGGLSLGLDISNWNTSNVTNMAYMFFRYCGTSLDLSELDTSNVISMSSMFDGCTANVLNLSSFDTSSVTDTTDMFRGCTTTRIVVDVDKWTLDTSSGVFYNYNGKVYIGDTEIMTKANSDRDIATSLNSALANYWKTMYPIGSIYTSVNNVNPSTFWGGTWESIGSGRVLWGATEDNVGGTEIEAGLPNITSIENRLSFVGWGGDSGNYGAIQTRRNSSTNLGFGGGGGDYCNLTFNASKSNSIYKDSCDTVQPPAYCVYFWKRTA